MPTDEEIHSALLAIHSRLGVIDGKVNLVARAERPHLLKLLEALIRSEPSIGQIYLLLDGKRTQKKIFEVLSVEGIKTSEMTVSRRVRAMHEEHGIADFAPGGGGKIYRKNGEMETVLNLSANVRKWLRDEGQFVPEDETRRRRRKGEGDDAG